MPYIRQFSVTNIVFAKLYTRDIKIFWDPQNMNEKNHAEKIPDTADSVAFVKKRKKWRTILF